MPSQPVSFSKPSEDPILKQFLELEDKMRQLRPHEDVSLLRQAYDFAAGHHHLQKRKSGEPYLAHPVAVAHLLADMRLDVVAVTTGLLHDVVEDTKVGLEELRQRFSPEIAACVDGVTKLGQLGYHSAEDRQAENFRKMLLAMVDDIRIILVKLADRLHNMRTLEFLDSEKQKEISRETLEIYAPIALRLGMGKIRGELEDLAFRYIEPEAYTEITHQIELRRETSQEFLEEMKRKVSKQLAEAGITARIDGRIKRTYSIYQKLKRQRINVDRVYDLLALRVITDSEKNCYAVLGLVHSQWRPVPGRFKDFIAMQRPNLYQSLHTSVITDQGQTFELQIRTEEMHRRAEEGICAHWKYKEGKVGADIDDHAVSWLRQLVEWQQDVKDSSDFLSTLKVDLYLEEVYVFTPKGKLLVLPKEATPIDFAYAIHTEVGHHCVSAKANGRIVLLKYCLRNGDIIEIITQKSHTPVQDWLNVVKTSRARNNVKQWLNAQERRKAEEIGRKLLEREARRLHVSLGKVSRQVMKKVCCDYGCTQVADLHAALGYGRYSARQVVSKLAPETEKTPVSPTTPETSAPEQATTPKGVLHVSGIDDLLVYRARCCNPIKGEPIVGYVTRGKGVAVHSKNCPNVENLMYEAERRMDVQWVKNHDLTYQTKLNIYVDDRPGLLADLTNILSSENVNITRVESDSPESNRPAVVEMTLEVLDVKQLQRIIVAMKQVPEVREVARRTRN